MLVRVRRCYVTVHVLPVTRKKECIRYIAKQRETVSIVGARFLFSTVIFNDYRCEKSIAAAFCQPEYCLLTLRLPADSIRSILFNNSATSIENYYDFI